MLTEKLVLAVLQVCCVSELGRVGGRRVGRMSGKTESRDVPRVGGRKTNWCLPIPALGPIQLPSLDPWRP